MNPKNDDGWTALHQAHNGHEVVVGFLVENKANVNAKDNSRSTALHRAAKYGHLKVVTLLIMNGADICAKDNR